MKKRRERVARYYCAKKREWITRFSSFFILSSGDLCLKKLPFGNFSIYLLCRESQINKTTKRYQIKRVDSLNVSRN